MRRLLGYLAVQVGEGVRFVLPALARKPKLVVALAARAPFQSTFCAVTLAPLLVRVAPQYWVMVCPSGNVQDTVHPVMAELPARTVTSPWKPPCQLPVMA
jgi:hypothetical protein